MGQFFSTIFVDKFVDKAAPKGSEARELDLSTLLPK
jgi:hypothetical protein